MTIAYCIQIRNKSSRLPFKALLPVNSTTLLDILLMKVVCLAKINPVYIITTQNPEDKILDYYAKKYDVNIFYGDEKNVAKRYYDAVAGEPDITHVVRITADDFIFDSEILLYSITKALSMNLDYYRYLGTIHDLTFEIMSVRSLKQIARIPHPKFSREFLTYFYTKTKNSFSVLLDSANIFPSKYVVPNDLRVTVDTQEDYIKILKIFSKFKGEEVLIEAEDILKYFKRKR